MSVHSEAYVVRGGRAAIETISVADPRAGLRAVVTF